jgi:hypothetical protein
MLLQHFQFGLHEDNAMKLDALSGVSFVFLGPERGKEILREIRDISSPSVSSNEVAK